MSDENIEIQSSGPAINLESSLGDDEDGFIEFEFETRAIFHRLADDIYKSTEAGIREPLANSITATRQAVRKYGIENPVIEIKVQDGERPRLVIQDNGVGISETVLRKVLAVIGNTTNLDDGSVSGKYGMGFLACYKLVGTNGGFLMHTRSRETGEDMTGIWKPGGFDMDSENKFTNPFVEQDRYGTRFEFDLTENISRMDVRNWVKKHAEWSRIPVIYTEEDSNGVEVYNEDYGTKKLEEQYDETDPTLKIENEFFSAYCSPSAKSRTILLDSPIDRNYRLSDTPWSVDIRFKDENKIVIDGPNKGQTPVEDSEYESMSDHRKEVYIPQRKLTPNDIQLPGPTGTRDSLAEEEAFWEWIAERFHEKYIDLSQEKLSLLDDDGTGFFDLDEKDRSVIVKVLDHTDITSHTGDKLQQSLSRWGISLSDENAEMLSEITETVRFANRETSTNGSITYEYGTEVWKVLQEAGDDGRVFMGCKPNSKKVRVVWGDNENNQVVKVSSTDMYDEFEEKYGWERLTEIKGSTIDEFDVDDSLKQLFNTRSNGNKSHNTKTNLTVYYGDLKNDTPMKKSPNQISKCLDPENGDGVTGLGNTSVKLLIVFPRSGNKNVTDNKHLVNDRVGVASCTTDQWEILSDTPNVIHGDDYFANATERTFITPNGEKAVKEMDLEEDVMFHVLPEETVELFRQPEIMEGAQKYVQTEIQNRYGSTKPKYPHITYAPVTKRELDMMRPALPEYTNILMGDAYYDMGSSERIQYDARIYSYARLPDWRDNQEVTEMDNFKGRLVDGALSIIETMAKLHDNGIKPATMENINL